MYLKFINDIVMIRILS